MPSRHDPADSLTDIIENADRIESYLRGVDRDGLAHDGLLRDAAQRCLERVCEAAHRLGSGGADLMPDQPWDDIRGLGNWLRHAYDRISLDIIWNAVRYDVPNLATAAKQALERLRAEGGGKLHP